MMQTNCNCKLVAAITVTFLLYFLLASHWQTVKTVGQKIRTRNAANSSKYAAAHHYHNVGVEDMEETNHVHVENEKEHEEKENPAIAYHNVGMEDVTRSRSPVSVSEAGPESFSVVSYNILADCYIREGMYPNMPPGCQTSEERHPRLLAELEALDGDIVQLQEVGEDYFNKTLGPAMQKLGYNQEFKLKTSGCEGLATFYKTDKFELVEKQALSFNDMLNEAKKAGGYNDDTSDLTRRAPQVFLMVKLRHNSTRSVVSIGNIHAIYGSLRALAVSTLQLALAVQTLLKSSDGKSHIISGDMNHKPGMAPYTFLENGKLTDQSKAYLEAEEHQYKPLWEGMEGLYRHNSTSLASSYKVVLGKEPDFTNYETSFGRSYADCLDYIWYSGDSLKVHSVLKTVGEEDIEGAPEKRLPNCLFPSDHLSLKAVFSFK